MSILLTKHRITPMLAAFALFAALFAAACSGGGGTWPAAESDGTTDVAEPAATAATVADPTPSLAAEPDVLEDADDNVVDLVPDAPLGTGGAALLGALNPMQVLDITAGLSSSAQPELAAQLLRLEDLPPGFAEMGDFSLSTPSEYGDIDMAATMFEEGGFAEEDFAADGSGEMVVSMAVDLPPAALAEIGELTELIGFGDAELAEFDALTQEFGVDFAQFEALDASSLGDDSFGLHMEIDFGGLFSAFGELTGDIGDDAALPTGFAIDMYGTLRGETMLMVMTMRATGVPSSVDALQLAQLMSGRAGS